MNFASPIRIASATYPDAPGGPYLALLTAYGVNGTAATIQSQQTIGTEGRGNEPVNVVACAHGIKSIQIELAAPKLYITSISFAENIPPPSISCSVSAGSASVELKGTVGCEYRIEYSDELSPPNWTELMTTVLSSPSFVTTDPASAPQQRRFYRALESQ